MVQETYGRLLPILGTKTIAITSEEPLRNDANFPFQSNFGLICEGNC
ncbi:MAG: hypothetical protein FCKEOINB_00995 [Nitrosomonas sp.]|nr:hypothetical protein [Nitrosomonas sp.]